jgi:hypothetical protein
MKFLISRGNYQRLTAGMTAAERADIDAMFDLYPDRDQPDWHVDQGRIAARFAELRAEGEPQPEVDERCLVAPRRRRSSWPTAIVDDPLAVEPPAAARPAPLEGEVWVAPLGVPLTTELLDPISDFWAWPEDLADHLAEPRGWMLLGSYGRLNQWSEPTAETVMDSIRAFNEILDQTELPGPRRLLAGATALAAISAAATPHRHGWAKDSASTAGNVARLAGVPIVEDPDLPPNAWRLVDPDSGTVLFEGTVNPDLDDYLAAHRQAVDEMAEEFDVPRWLLDPFDGNGC